MPTVTFQFDTFSSEDSGVAWSDPGNAVSEGSGSATVALTSGNPTSELLVCTGADLSSEFPAGTVVQSVKVRIKARIDDGLDGATIDEIYAWDGSAIQGRNMAGYPSSVEGAHDVLENDPISLDAALMYSDRGVADWLWWRINRLEDDTNGVAIRVKWDEGTPTVEIDHVELEITYVQLFQETPVVDYRVTTYKKVAGPGSGTETNEGGETYHPGSLGTVAWHTDPEEYLTELIKLRTEGFDVDDGVKGVNKGFKRLVFGTPAGTLQTFLVPGSQWEPMYDEQRAALTKVIPNWLKGDPEREAILYVGSRIHDPSNLQMPINLAHIPDVTDSDDLAILERTLIPYRDFVGIKRFLMDNSSPIDDRVEVRALFAWARDNGMEFVAEAIPHEEETPHTPTPDPLSLDETITEVYSAYSLGKYILETEGFEGHDKDHLWDFPKGRLLVQARTQDHDSDLFSTPAKTRAFLQGFAREGYGLIPHDAGLLHVLGEPARIVAEEHIGRGVASSVSSTSSHTPTNSVTRFVEGQRTSGNGR